MILWVDPRVIKNAQDTIDYFERTKYSEPPEKKTKEKKMPAVADLSEQLGWHASELAGILRSHIPVGVRGQSENQFRAFPHNNLELERRTSCIYRFWRSRPHYWGDPFDDGSYIEFEVRPKEGESKFVPGPQVLLDRQVVDHAVGQLHNDLDRPQGLTYEYEEGSSHTTSHDVGVALTAGFEQKIGNDNTPASATFKQELTASFNKHWEQGETAMHTVTVGSDEVEAALVPKHTKRVVTNSIERARFRQTNKITGKIDFIIRVHAYWWFTWKWDSRGDLLKTLRGQGLTSYNLEHDLVQAFAKVPCPDNMIQPLTYEYPVEYEDTVEVDRSRAFDLRVIDTPI